MHLALLRGTELLQHREKCVLAPSPAHSVSYYNEVLTLDLNIKINGGKLPRRKRYINLHNFNTTKTSQSFYICIVFLIWVYLYLSTKVLHLSKLRIHILIKINFPSRCDCSNKVTSNQLRKVSPCAGFLWENTCSMQIRKGNRRKHIVIRSPLPPHHTHLFFGRK